MLMLNIGYLAYHAQVRTGHASSLSRTNRTRLVPLPYEADTPRPSPVRSGHASSLSRTNRTRRFSWNPLPLLPTAPPAARAAAASPSRAAPSSSRTASGVSTVRPCPRAAAQRCISEGQRRDASPLGRMTFLSSTRKSSPWRTMPAPSSSHEIRQPRRAAPPRRARADAPFVRRSQLLTSGTPNSRSPRNGCLPPPPLHSPYASPYRTNARGEEGGGQDPALPPRKRGVRARATRRE
jgi:hypothetical protein